MAKAVGRRGCGSNFTQLPGGKSIPHRYANVRGVIAEALKKLR